MINKILSKLKRKKRYRNNIIPSFLSWQKSFKKRKWYSLKLDFILKKSNFNNKILINTVFILLLVFILFLIFWPILRVKKIEITRKDYITNINIAYKSVDDIRWKSIFLVNFDNIKEKLKKYQPDIKDIKLKISFPNLLNIEIYSYSWVFNTNIKWNNYIITSNGILVPLKKYSEIKNIQIIYSKLDNIQIPDYKKVFDSKYINDINYIVNKLEENIVTIKIKTILYYVNEREVHLITDSGIRLIYNLIQNIDNQIKKTVILNKQYYKINKWWLVYIDFRVKDKIYYCSLKTETICKDYIKRIYMK